MQAGKLDRRITIERPTDTQGAAGGAAETWAKFATVWAEKVELRGREYFAAQQHNAEIDVKFRLRYLAGVTPAMRIVYDGVNYDIQHVAELGRREGLEIMARVHRA